MAIENMGGTVGQQTDKVRQVQVSREEEGQRIDNFLARHLKGVPRRAIYRILRRGEVRVNSGRIQPRYKLKAGDTVRIPPLRVAATSRQESPGGIWFSLIEDRVLFENARILVIDKPAGIAVHGGSGISHGVIEMLRGWRPASAYLELVHRLDRDTSGCLIIAKRRSALRSLHAQLRDGSVRKRYLALLRGQWSGGSRMVNAPLKKNRLQGGERVVRVEPEGKPATTVFHPLVNFGPACLVEIELQTGRTHQIRVHAAHIGQPLAGDGKYGDHEFNRLMKTLGLERLFLHAHMIEFHDEARDEFINVSAPLDDDLRQVLDRLERHD
ncbi:MAG: 23S rRNA pseudouridine(955/2504/2580) synthase RluC [Gammaproteobacteria bacterium]|jgi:23S rRNA pseudouridine955/2504/2580 synthase